MMLSSTLEKLLFSSLYIIASFFKLKPNEWGFTDRSSTLELLRDVQSTHLDNNNELPLLRYFFTRLCFLTHMIRFDNRKTNRRFDRARVRQESKTTYGGGR